MDKYTINNDKRNRKKKRSGIFANKGFYIILFVCIAIVGISTILRNMSKSVINQIDSGMNDKAWKEEIESKGLISNESPSSGTKAVPAVSTVSENEAQKSEPKPSSEDKPLASPVAESQDSDGEFRMANPVLGGIIKKFSKDTLVYSKTMDDWRVHDGIDIETELGAQVKAAAAGVVEKVYEDDMLGITVVVGHSNGLKTLYANLQSLDFVSVGKKVKAGDIIGGIGNTAVSECAENPHLHFEVLQNSQSVDPSGYLNL